jgi:hypothetical protein
MADQLNRLIGKGLAIARWAPLAPVRASAGHGVRWLNLARQARRQGLEVTTRVSLAVALEHFKQARDASSRLSR